MTRGGAKREREGESLRRCIATGVERPKSALLRFVVGPEGQAVPDLAEKLPGRGIWVSAERGALERAVTRKLFSRSAKAQVAVPDGLVAAVEAGLARRVTELVSLARKAGGAVSGYEKVRAWLDDGRAHVLLQASDGSERGKTKLKLPPEDGPTIGVLSAGELGLSFGRDRVIHAALSGGGLTARIVLDAGRLAGLRASDMVGIGAAAPERTKNSHERQ
ncbi:MAG: RNA-binding protein [Pseudomonadota bacterium]